MNQENRKKPGRPKKYEDDAARQKAYRERKKKRLEKIHKKVGQLEQDLVNMSEVDNKIAPEIRAIHEEIKAPWINYTSSELVDLENEQLERIQTVLITRYTQVFGNPLLGALKKALMPTLNKEFEKKFVSEKSFQELLKERLINKEDISTPKTNTTVEEYIQKIKEKEPSAVSSKDWQKILSVHPSSIEKKSKGSESAWEKTHEWNMIQPLFEALQQIILLYNVESEIARRKREERIDSDINKLEAKIEQLEKLLAEEKRTKTQKIDENIAETEDERSSEEN